MLNNIKLIVWDLDETLWLGTLSDEGDVTIDNNIKKLLQNTTDAGIVNTICSKNDFENAKAKLQEIELWDYFVFPSINWNPKGERLRDLIRSMRLRPVNVLFLDDNVQNLEEAKYYCHGIHVASPNVFPELFIEGEKIEKKDTEHKRLNQYRVLEKKGIESKSFSSNEDFLISCNIKVDIKTDCVNHIERIYELLIRSNQLNYTKRRSTVEELSKIIVDESYDCGYISVKDRFGDYGIVGFYALKDNNLVHFTFSCRTLGMLVEQYVYMKLGCPKLDIVGEVITQLNCEDIPKWINNSADCVQGEANEVAAKILMKGPCDLEQIFSFIKKNNNIVSEFSYTNEKGILTEGYNHPAQIVTSIAIDENREKEILDERPFLDRGMFDTALKDNNFHYVMISMLTVGNLGVYKRKDGPERISLCEKYYDLTNKKNWKGYMDGKYFTSGIRFNEKTLLEFSEKYTFVKDVSFDDVLKDLNYILEYIDKSTKLILLLGSEREFKKKCKESYIGRAQEHVILNKKIIDWASNKQNVILIRFDNYIKSDNDFLDTINHFVKRVYFDLAHDLIEILNQSGAHLQTKSASSILTQSLSPFIHKNGSIIKHKIIDVKSRGKPQ